MAIHDGFVALFVWTYQQNMQQSNSVFLSQQTSEQYFQHNKPAKRTGCVFLAVQSGVKRFRSRVHHGISRLQATPAAPKQS
jgi:hypothetical protein